MANAESILEEAQRIIYGDRERTYGHPAKNFENTAAFWKVWLSSKHGLDVPLDVEDVAMMMSLLKLARQAHGHKRDNLVDLCGYAACVQKVLDHGSKARNDVLHVGASTSPAGTLPDEAVQSVRERPGGSLVFGHFGGSVGGVEVLPPAETQLHDGQAGPFTDATGVDGCKIT